MGDDELAERVSQLEDNLETLVSDRERYRSDVLRPRLESLEADRDDARQTRVELQAAVETLQSRVAELERDLEALGGVADSSESTPTKRAVDLRQGLIQEARSRADATVVTMHYKDVQRYLARIGHGEVSKPDCYKAMHWAAGDAGSLEDSPAFVIESDGATLNGRSVKAILVDLDLLPSTAGYTPGSSPTTGETGTQPSQQTN